MVWNISTREEPDHTAVITRTYGYENGTQQHISKVIERGKNIGKKNETSPYEQACKEAKSTWTNQKQSGYSEDKTESVCCKPMLAQPFKSEKTRYPCIVQPKLDGVRLWLSNTHALSRTGKDFSQNLKYLLGCVPAGITLDGELYTHGVSFDSISGTLRNTNDTDTKLQFHVYDIVDTNKSYETRLACLQKLVLPPMFHIVDTQVAKCIDDILSYHQSFVKQGYEGLMVRDAKSFYEYKRTYSLQKLKSFLDSEYEIVNVKEATGEDRGTAIVQCKTTNGNLFWVRPTGTREFRSHLLKAFDEYKGKMLTVKYQNLTANGIPRFPVGIYVRDFE